MALAAGTNLGPYEIEAPLGAGGMGEVYVAKDPRLGREVAVKVLPEHLAKDPELLARFEREAKLLATLSHPNILVIHDFGHDQGVSFAVTELLEGETLRSRLNKSAFTWSKAVETAILIAEGLSAAHSKSVIHRDLKPENIFLTSPGGVKILDFGLARIDPVIPGSGASIVQTIAHETLPGTVLGTIHYMSPEQMRGTSVDARSDLFSFGCVLYEMVAGKKPFLRTTPADTMAAILKEEPSQISSAGFIPTELIQLIQHCLQKRPEDRFQSAHDLVYALRIIPLASNVFEAPISKPTTTRRRSKRTIDSLAILPFINASGDADSEYLSDGITESIINTLSQIPKLRVMARSTVFRYKDRVNDPQVIGAQLNVQAVLTGRVFLREEVLTVQTELVDIHDGSQIWGERYTRRMCDIFELPEEIAKEISEKLRLRLIEDEKKRLAKRHTKNPTAYQLYLKGRFHWNKRTEEGFRKAIEYFEEAIREDPQYALAYSGLSDCYSLLAGFGYLNPADGYTKATKLAEKALEIDDLLGEAHASLAVIKYRYEWKWAEAEQEFRKAIDLNPGYPTARLWRAVYLIMVGRFEDGIVEIEQAIELDPLSLVVLWTKGYLLYYMRRYDDAIEQLQRTLELEPNFMRAHFDLGIAYLQKAKFEEGIAEFKTWIDSERNPGTESLLGYAYAASGKKKEALEMIEYLKEQSAQRYVSNYSIAMIYIALGEKDEAFEWLEKAHIAHEDPMISLKINPRLDSLRDDPRFSKLLKAVGLPV